MSWISKVEISLGRTVNLGNYNSFRAEVTMVEEFAEGEYSETEYESLREYVYSKLQLQVEKILP